MTHIAWAMPINMFVNLNKDVQLHIKVKWRPIQSPKQFNTVWLKIAYYLDVIKQAPRMGVEPGVEIKLLYFSFPFLKWKYVCIATI